MPRYQDNPDYPGEKTVDILGQLVGFATVSADSNLDLIRYIEDYLAGHNVPVRLFLNEARTKANLFATIGPTDQPGVILSGHTDVVPVTGQDWTHDPFRLRQAEGRLYGRGAADMKGFIACVLAAVPALTAAPLTTPIHLAFSYDEEVGCTGCRSMIEHVAALGVRPKLCIVGEPTEMGVVNAHKGIRDFMTEITGRPAHSSQPAQGANAIVAAGRLIAWLADEASARQSGPRVPGSARFDPPYTTLNIGEISGGNALNIIAEHARFTWECRSLPDEDVDDIRDRFLAFAKDTVLENMRTRAPEARIDTHEIAHAPPLTPSADDWAESFVLALTGSNEVGAVAYATEAGHFQRTAHVPTLVCGPGSISQAHKPDEWIALTELRAGEDFIAALMRALT